MIALTKIDNTGQTIRKKTTNHGRPWVDYGIFYRITITFIPVLKYLFLVKGA